MKGGQRGAREEKLVLTSTVIVSERGEHLDVLGALALRHVEVAAASMAGRAIVATIAPP